jgi:hypothetical protein
MRVTIADSAPDRVIYNISGCTKEELDNKLTLFFSSEGYKQVAANGENRVYEKGNRAMRILFGAFSKYHKQSITIKNQENLYSLMLHRDSTGMSGGLIGMNQVNKEFNRLTQSFNAYFS